MKILKIIVNKLNKQLILIRRRNNWLILWIINYKLFIGRLRRLRLLGTMS